MINSKDYLRMFPDYFWRESEDYKMEGMWFQQGEATSYTTLANRARLQENYQSK